MKFVECPRDAWQGMTRFIPTERKTKFLSHLLEAGFTNLDCGSFVSEKAVPQMADTETVLNGLPATKADLLCIVANPKGLTRALACKPVTSVGYPLSISDTFQRRNTNFSLEDSWMLVQEIHDAKAHLQLVVYLSMGFGNPYNDPWNIDLVLESVARLREIGVQNIALADTYGQADAKRVFEVTKAVIEQFGATGIGVHLHARAENALGLTKAALQAGATWFEGALGGIGGCPFAGDDLVGNLPTEQVLPLLNINLENLQVLAQEALEIRLHYA
jgi:hydroxymethylglutaryl-CoA lyase